MTLKAAIFSAAGAAIAVALVLLGLYGWRHAGEIVERWDPTRPAVAAWAVRSAAVAAAAGAQLVLLALVTGRLYRRQLFDDVLSLSAGLVGAVALVAAIALGLAGR
jgi:hypothetical protein